MRASKPASLLFAVLLILLVLSFSISIPILYRPFYYLQIDALHLPEQTGWSAEVIRDAYDEVLDFCVLGKPFGTGELAWSESGRSHFEDVKLLFTINFFFLAASAVGSACLLIWKQAKKIQFQCLLGRGPAFWAGSVTVSFAVLIALLAVMNFNQVFIVFHSIFFPGKDNWLFNPTTDQIILIMPELFFRNCAILIGTVLVICCVGLILWDLLHSSRVREHISRSIPR